MEEGEQAVGRYYDEAIYEAELARLTRDFPVELAVTSRVLDRWIPGGALVAEIGVGGGQYSELLVHKGCRLHLVDVSARLLGRISARLPREALVGTTHASATDLAGLPDAAFDAVLLLGPLYHFCAEADRRRAVAEAARVLKPGGMLFAAGINRLAYFRALFAEQPLAILDRQDFHERHLRDGNLDPLHAPPIGLAHLTTVEEFRSLFDAFEPVDLLGVESFTAPWQKTLNTLPPGAADAWIDIVERTARTAEGLGQTDHFLYVGRRVRRCRIGRYLA